jgi:geranylgeranyl pyrophosphate synthase
MESIRSYFDDYMRGFIAEQYPPTNDLNRAVAYALEGTGKRVRPIYALLSCQSLGGDLIQALPCALAVEMIHSYSLIHDDLPCMDNDSLRRGRATTHIAFGEALALLAGDALLTDAFQVLLLTEQSTIGALLKLRQAAELSSAAGSKGMVLGQCLDLHWTDRAGADKEILDTIHLKKTGCLIGAACAMGAVAAGADVETEQNFREFGMRIGLAFQIYDDLLDGDEQTGKSKGKDANANKLTYLRMMSANEARDAAKALTESAISLVQTQGRADDLIKFSSALLLREN